MTNIHFAFQPTSESAKSFTALANRAAVTLRGGRLPEACGAEAGLAKWQSGPGVGLWRISARAERNASSVNFLLNRRVMTGALRLREPVAETFWSSSPPPTR